MGNAGFAVFGEELRARYLFLSRSKFYTPPKLETRFLHHVTVRKCNIRNTDTVTPGLFGLIECSQQYAVIRYFRKPGSMTELREIIGSLCTDYLD